MLDSEGTKERPGEALDLAEYVQREAFDGVERNVTSRGDRDSGVPNNGSRRKPRGWRVTVAHAFCRMWRMKGDRGAEKRWEKKPKATWSSTPWAFFTVCGKYGHGGNKEHLYTMGF